MNMRIVREFQTMWNMKKVKPRLVDGVSTTNQDQGVTVRELLDSWLKGDPKQLPEERKQFFGVPLEDCGDPTGFETGYDKDAFDAYDYMRANGKKAEPSQPVDLEK